MNDIAVKKAELPAAVAGLANMATNIHQHAATIQTGDAYGKFAKDGTWIFGQEAVVVEEGSQWAFNPHTFRHGSIFWPEVKGDCIELMVPMTDPRPELPETTEPGKWSDSFGAQAVCLNGEDKDQQVLWKGNSLGYKKAFIALAQQVVARAGEGLTDIVPVVELLSGHYNHSQYGKIYTPEFKVVGWMELDGTVAEEEPETAPEPEPEPEKAPTRRRRVRK